MNEENDLILALTLLTVFWASCYGAYKAGRYLERKDLTAVFVRMTQKTYSDGYQDGMSNANRWSYAKEVQNPGN